jgi:hypothetical protein
MNANISVIKVASIVKGLFRKEEGRIEDLDNHRRGVRRLTEVFRYTERPRKGGRERRKTCKAVGADQTR